MNTYDGPGVKTGPRLGAVEQDGGRGGWLDGKEIGPKAQSRNQKARGREARGRASSENCTHLLTLLIF